MDDPESVFRSGARGSASDGAGLGLALSRRVARTLGGDVTDHLGRPAHELHAHPAAHLGLASQVRGRLAARKVGA